MTLVFETPDGQRWTTPRGYTSDQAAAMDAVTTVQTYIDGDREVITVLTRCGPPAGADLFKWETDASFWMDGNWIDWVVDTYPGWRWANGTGEHDSGGEWFAQEHRLGDDFLWLAVGSRPKGEEE